MTKVGLWKIGDGKSLEKLRETTLRDLGYKEETDMESWIADDISIISEDLMVIGRQVRTDYNKEIDLLCIDITGDIVIIELKRNKTPREVIAQILDYASWVNDLSSEQIKEIWMKEKKEKSLEDAFKEKFGFDLPKDINEHHSMLIVALEIDSDTERVVKYLVDTYGVDINLITLQFFKDSKDNECMARIFSIDPKEHREKILKSSAYSKRTNVARILEAEKYVNRFKEILEQKEFTGIEHKNTRIDWRIYHKNFGNKVWLRIHPQRENLKIVGAGRYGTEEFEYKISYNELKDDNCIKDEDLKKLKESYDVIFPAQP